MINNFGTRMRKFSQDFWLRLDLDEQLSFDVHIDSLCKKISKRIGILNRIKAYLPRTERILYDNSLIKPLILYCSVTRTSCCSHDNIYLRYLSNRNAVFESFLTPNNAMALWIYLIFKDGCHITSSLTSKDA